MQFVEIDGLWHRVGDPDCCRKNQCPCGGEIHTQGVWGGYVQECDTCGLEGCTRRESLLPPGSCENPEKRHCTGDVWLETLTCTNCGYRHAPEVFI